MKAKRFLTSGMITAFLLVLMTGLAVAQSPDATPLGTGFTYQGQLKSDGSPYTGSCDFQFGLYDAATTGVLMGETTVTGVTVSEGIFTTQLDFGSDMFTGDNRWLEIWVRCPAGSGTYQQLLPRQPLTAAPYALYAEGANWYGITNMPADFSDGWDNDTTYTAGSGLILAGTSFSVDTSVIQERVDGVCGPGSAIKQINSDGSVLCESVGNTGWSLTGNSGTIPGTNYIGTSDDQALEIKVNNLRVFRYEPYTVSPNLIGGHSANAIISGVYGATVNGGGASDAPNIVTDQYGTIGGGVGNQAGDGDTDPANKLYTTISGGAYNIASGDNATISGGFGNYADGFLSFIGGGTMNSATGVKSTIGGGDYNQATGQYSTVFAGYQNWAMGEYSTTGGGGMNHANANFSTVCGGNVNSASGEYAFTGGGSNNQATGEASTVSGGSQNYANASLATISGGLHNSASDTGASIGGGSYNNASSDYAFVGGGSGNTASGEYSTVGGGIGNEAVGTYSSVGGGNANVATGNNSTIGGGYVNIANGIDATIGGGSENTASQWAATVGGGSSNAAGYGATISGGALNAAAGWYAIIPGGYSNTAPGDGSFAAGTNANANNDGCFVWADSTSGELTCSNTDRWMARASGGVYFYTNAAASSGMYLAAGGSAWNAVSSSDLKENFIPLDTEQLLANLAQYPISSWNYKSQDESVVHVGMMADEFNSLITGLGGEGKNYINSMDAVGVSLAAIQGLYAENLDLKAELANQQSQINSLETRLVTLEAGRSVSAGLSNSAVPWMLLFGLLAISGLWFLNRRSVRAK